MAVTWPLCTSHPFPSIFGLLHHHLTTRIFLFPWLSINEACMRQLSAVSHSRKLIDDRYLEPCYSSGCSGDIHRGITRTGLGGGVYAVTEEGSLPLYSLSLMAHVHLATFECTGASLRRHERDLCSIAKYSQIRVRSSCFVFGTKIIIFTEFGQKYPRIESSEQPSNESLFGSDRSAQRRGRDIIGLLGRRCKTRLRAPPLFAKFVMICHQKQAAATCPAF
jgi:hypothetical protein